MVHCVQKSVLHTRRRALLCSPLNAGCQVHPLLGHQWEVWLPDYEMRDIVALFLELQGKHQIVLKKSPQWSIAYFGRKTGNSKYTEMEISRDKNKHFSMHL